MERVAVVVGRAQSPDVPLNCRQEAFAELVTRFQDFAYGYAYALLGDSHLAQDAAQEAFVSVYQNLPQLREAGAFAGWLRSIVRTHCARVRRGTPRDTVPIEAMAARDHLSSASPDPHRAAETRELQEILTAAIKVLPDHERVATVLFYIGGYRQREIAQFLGVSVMTVKKRLQAARKRLQAHMLDDARTALQKHAPSRSKQFVAIVRLRAFLEEAASVAREAVDDLLLLDGIDVDALGERRTAVQREAARQRADAAAMESELHVIDLLLLDGLAVDDPGADGTTLLSWAAQRRYEETPALRLAQ